MATKTRGRPRTAKKLKGIRKPSKRTKPAFLPGMEPPSCPKIDSAAEHYDEIKRERAALSKQEAEAQDSLISAMKDEGLTGYKTPSGIACTLVAKNKVVTKHESNGEASDED